MPEDSGRPAESATDVFIVDDDTDVRDSLGELLRDEGYRVSSARNGAEALSALSTRPAPGIILLDLMMPVLNGWSVLEELRGSEATARIPVAVISAQRVAMPEGSDAVIEKPIELERLLDVVATYCGKGDGRSGE